MGTQPPLPLPPAQLYRACATSAFAFETTAELEDLGSPLGQERAEEAIRFGIGIRRPGYNIFAMGPVGLGRHSIVRGFLDQRAAAEAAPADWCYVHDFAAARTPKALRLPAGHARRFCDHMQRLIEDLVAAIAAAFETEEYRARVQEIEAELTERQEKALTEFRQRAKQKDINLIRTPGGFALAPMRGGEVIELEAFHRLASEEQKRFQTAIAEFHEELEKLLHEMPKWRREVQHKIRELNRAVTRTAVNSLIDELKKEYAGLEQVQTYLTEVQADVIENADDFRRPKEGETPMVFGVPIPQPDPAETTLRRYRVNVLVDHGETKGAPIVYEDNPTHDNLVGRIEHFSQMGTLVTDFTLIRPGALHRANGGYLIVDALRVILQPFAWEALKRALHSREIKMASLGQMLSLVSTVSLEPEPIPLDIKVVLVGERPLYYLLHAFDPDFAEHFKVAADFDDEMNWSGDAMLLYARLVATLARKEGLRPFDRGAVARILEHGGRLSGDAQKLCTHGRSIADLLREADYWAGCEGRQLVTRADVQRSIDAQERRADRIRVRLEESFERGTILLDTGGEKVGQVNGLSVLQLGGFAFGHPSRITARVRMGSGKVVDIEREVELGGPIHSKGVLILSGFLAGRFVPNQPLSLAASLVFEQSYGGVEGDSASSAELYALLSALAGAPIRQAFAVTGSVNQMGEVQAIGGVNEKIEGFFAVCRARGLTGEQGVLIPAANVAHLMLRREVVEAAAAGKFKIIPIRTVDEGIEILTGIPAGQRDEHGEYPKDTVNARVEARLAEFAARSKELQAPAAAQDKQP